MLVFARGRREQGMEGDCQWIWGFEGSDEGVLKSAMVMVMHLCDYTRNHRVVH